MRIGGAANQYDFSNLENLDKFSELQHIFLNFLELDELFPPLNVKQPAISSNFVRNREQISYNLIFTGLNCSCT